MSFLQWFIDPIKNHYVDFQGRATRQQFWMFVLVYVIIAIVIALIEAVAGIPFLSVIYMLALLLPYLALGARRLHDTGLSGWWQVINIVPIIGMIILIVLFARKGQPGMNKYGANVTE